MFCMKCLSAITADDMFCPKCGAVLRGPRPGEPQPPPPAAAAAAVVDADATQTGRVTALRDPLSEGGKKYVGLTTAAEVMINGAATIRMLSYVAAGLAGVSALVWLQPQWLLGLLVGGGVALFTIILGWWSWLSLTVVGELVYVVIDVEENLRRRV